jgi:hypothetical protein
MYDDQIVEEVRKIRERMAERYNFDVGAIFEDLRKRQSTIKKRLVRRVRNGVAESGSRGFFSPSPHTTRHAGPHRAVHRDYRAVAG